MDTKDRPIVEAVATYDAAHAALLRKAKEHEQAARPILASIARHQAAIVARAALAEELDPQPRGLDHDDVAREGWR